MLGLSIDPGMSTGICSFSFKPDQPFMMHRLWQVTGGAVGLAEWMDENQLKRDSLMGFKGMLLGALVVEKFTPRGGTGFSLTQASAEPLRCEGVLIGRGFNDRIQWAEPSAQYFMGGNSLSEKKKRSREFLKQNNTYVTGKDVGQKDANDAISAELHAIAYLRRIKHMPTLRAMFPET